MGRSKGNEPTTAPNEGFLARAVVPETLFTVLWPPADDLLAAKYTAGEERAALRGVEEETEKRLAGWSAVLRLLRSAFLWGFVAFTFYQIVYGTVQNVVMCLEELSLIKGRANPVHHFQYFLIDATLDFSRQSHWILLSHSVSAGIFILLSFLQTSSVRSVLFSANANPAYHRLVGSICLFCSLIASASAWILSFRALYGTEAIYLMGTSIWLLCTIMAFVRAKQRRWIAHSRWALTLQEIGVMFSTTRIIAPLCLLAGTTIGDSYHWAVWGAGVTAMLIFAYGETNRQQLTAMILQREAAKKGKRGPSLAAPPALIAELWQGYLGKVMTFSLIAFVFGGAPLIRYTDLGLAVSAFVGLPLTRSDLLMYTELAAVLVYGTLALASHARVCDM